MSEQTEIVIGVDAGGTKTHAILVGIDGAVLGLGVGGPANPNRVTPDQMGRSLKDAIDSASTGSGHAVKHAVRAICLGVAGSKGNQDLIRDVVVALGLDEMILVVSDTVIAFWSAISGSFGVAVIAGTGACAYGVGPGGQTATASGWGYLIGDEGSGYDIGRAGIAAASRAYDGRGPATDLVDRVLKFFGLATLMDIKQLIYHPPNGEGRALISDLAPVVAQAAREGDRVAQEIIRRAGQELGLSAVAVAHRLGLCDQAFELALVGGVFNAGELVTAPLSDVVRKAASRAQIFISRTPPVLGAARLALREIGRDVPIQDCVDL